MGKLSKHTNTTPTRSKHEILQNHFINFWANPGDIVYFKQGPHRGKKKDRIKWTVMHVEADESQCTWTKNGKVPNYIKLKGMVNGHELIVWTCDKYLVNSGIRK